jgi:hypothetical protein
MLETISAIRVQAIGLLSNCHTRGSHFRQKILDFRQAEAKRYIRNRIADAIAESAFSRTGRNGVCSELIDINDLLE